VPKRLSPAAVERYHRDGFHFPVPVLSADEARECRRKLEAFEATQQRGRLGGELRHKPHLIFTWLDALVRHPVILDAVEDLLGPNLLVWSSSFFVKEAGDDAYVSWHQDATYWGLSEPDVATAWVAITDSTVESGAMRMIPGTHREQVPHRDTFAPNNLLSRGQEIAVEVDEARAVDIVLRAGEMSLHHVRMFHGSPPNRSRDRRIGFAVRYVPTHVRQLAGEGDSALLVRGVDEFGHFAPEQRPTADASPEAFAHHAAIMERSARILYRGTGIERFK
jgi:ectoine hydroxylase-related dioxygenase (phytanoyl-CoA dioxygenase family)